MPDDNVALAVLRGARPVNLRFRPQGAATMQRHAAYMLPSGHPGAHRLEQLHAGGYLDSRQYANACAVLALWVATGKSGVAVSDCEPRVRQTGAGDVDRETAYDQWLKLLAWHAGSAKVDFDHVLQVVRCEVIEPRDHRYVFDRAKRGLARLDWLAARWDGEVWRAE